MARIKSLPTRKQKLADGAKAVGPPHENGGIDVVQQDTGQPVAEIEGGERVFSVEDTQVIEQACAQIIQLASQNPEAADQAAMQLGYTVCEMVQKQEQLQAGQQQVVAPESNPVYAAAANTFANVSDE